MNKVQNRMNERFLPEQQNRTTDCQYGGGNSINNRCGDRRLDRSDRREGIQNPNDFAYGSKLGELGNSCKSPEIKDDNAETIKAVVEQFTNLLTNAFTLIQEIMQGLFDLINKKSEAEAAAVAQPETPAAPAVETPAQTPVATPSDTAGTESTTPVTEVDTEVINDTKSKDANVSLLPKSGEFLWKPVSDKDGKLAILLPGNLTGKVKNVKIVDADGKVLSKGNYSGTGNPVNGKEREHFRFDKAGSSFPDGVTVEIKLENGKTKRIKIQETSERKIR